jgi:membrane protease YdiL (CAAX protease family)/tetratricopeptide (TPR) repeat protein
VNSAGILKRVVFYSFLLGFFIVLLLNLPPHGPAVPDSPDATYYYSLSKEQASQNKTAEAIVSAKKALGLDPQFGKALLHLGTCYNSRGETLRARRLYFKALPFLKDDPANFHITLYDIAITYQDERDPGSAWRFFRQAWAGAKDMPASCWPDDTQKLVYYVKKNDRKGFFARFESVYSGAARFAWPGELGGWHKELNRQMEMPWLRGRCLKEIRETVAENSGSRYQYAFYSLWARVLLKMQRYEDAFLVLERLKREDLPPASELWRLDQCVKVLSKLGRYDRAFLFLEQSLREVPSGVQKEDLLYIKARLEREAGDKAREQAALEEVIRLDPQGLKARSSREELMKSYYLSGDMPRAYALRQELRREVPLAAMVAGMVLLVGFLMGLFVVVSRIFFPRKRVDPPGRAFLTVDVFCFACVLGLVPFFMEDLAAGAGAVFWPRLAGSWLHPLFIGQLMGGGLVLLWGVWVWHSKWGLGAREAGLIWPGWKRIFKYIAVAFGAVLLFNAAFFILLTGLGGDLPDTAVSLVFERARESHNTGLLFFLGLTGVLWAPVFEELVFRVFFFQFFRRWANTGLAVFMGSVMFASLHDTAETFLPMFFMGVALSIVYVRSGSVVPGILLHALWNFCVFKIGWGW